jgi:hypothetical protein
MLERLRPIQQPMTSRHNTRRKSRHGRPADSYTLIVRGRDGQPRFERFGSAAAYKARLAKLHQSNSGSISIEELAQLLDT